MELELKKTISRRSTLPPSNTFKIIHFNDVYNVSANLKKRVCGGASRFTTEMKRIKKENPNSIIIFSGDLWSPSKSISKI